MSPTYTLTVVVAWLVIVAVLGPRVAVGTGTVAVLAVPLALVWPVTLALAWVTHRGRR